MQIEITLAEQDIGTIAVVTTPRLLRKPTTRRYVCAKADPWGGGRWICTETGQHADMMLESRINSTAQGVVELRRLGLRSD